jgi:hypothetical protein
MLHFRTDCARELLESVGAWTLMCRQLKSTWSQPSRVADQPVVGDVTLEKLTIL